MTEVCPIYQKKEHEIITKNKNEFQMTEMVTSAIIQKGLWNDFDKNEDSVEMPKNNTKEEPVSTNYYYQTGYSVKPLNSNTSKNDGMDSLSIYSNYNKLMFGIR